MTCAVSMDDERVRWGRKYLKLTRIVLSILLVGYNMCVLCCSTEGIEALKIVIWHLRGKCLYYFELRAMHNLFSEMIPAPLDRKSFNDFSAGFNSVILIKTCSLKYGNGVEIC